MSGEETLIVKLKDDTSHAKILCGMCESMVDPKDVSYCVDCSMYICSGCLKLHSKVPALSNHTLTETADKAIAEYSYCGTHRSVQMKFFCITCSLAICSECQVLAHLSHTCCNIEAEIENVRARLEARKSSVQESMSEEKQYRQELKRKLSDFKKVHDRVKHKLDLEKKNVLSEKLKIEQEFKQVDDANDERYRKFEKTMQKNMTDSDQRLTELQQKITDISQLITGLSNNCKTDSVALQVPNVPTQLATSTPECPQLVQGIQSTQSSQSRVVDVGTRASIKQSAVSVQTCSELASIKQSAVSVQTRSELGSLSRVADEGARAGIKQPTVSVQTCSQCITEGTIRFRVMHVKLCQPNIQYFSEEVTISNIPWSIAIERDRVPSGDLMYIGLFCNRHRKVNEQVSVEMEYTISLLHPKNTSKTITKHRNCTVTDRVGGFLVVSSSHCDWNDLVNKGFIKDTAITVEATVQVNKTKGIPKCPSCQLPSLYELVHKINVM